MFDLSHMWNLTQPRREEAGGCQGWGWERAGVGQRAQTSSYKMSKFWDQNHVSRPLVSPRASHVLSDVSPHKFVAW